jgi:ABC-type Fe3+ transport system substrate-binding protein
MAIRIVLGSPAPLSTTRRLLPFLGMLALFCDPTSTRAETHAQCTNQPTPAGITALLPEAKREGTVVFFNGSTQVTRSQMNQLSSAFEAKFGFPMNVVVAQLGPHAPMAQRLKTEAQRSVKPPFDVHATTARLLVPPREGGAIEQVDWPALGIPENKLLPTRDGFLIRTIPRNVTYNTKLVKKEDAPRRLEDLLDPKWKGKIVGPAFGGAYAYIAPILGEERTVDFVRKLVNEQRITFARSFTDVVAKVANGEALLGFGVPADLSHLRTKGAPIENAPLEKVSGANVYGAVMKNASHPAAAKVFLYFVACTPEGQKVSSQILSLATFDTPETEEFQIGGEGRGVLPSVEWMINDEDRISSDLEKLLGF